MHLSEKKEILTQRARIIRLIRDHFNSAGFLEVETPVRIPANAPEAYIDPVSSDGWQLQTSPEIAMKRMLCAGFEKIYQLARCFRKGESGRYHLPELTLLEWYEVDQNYTALMERCELFISELATTISGQPLLVYGGHHVDLTPPWPRRSLADAFLQYADRSLSAAIEADQYEEMLTDQVEPHLGVSRPVFIVDYPASMAALARRRPESPWMAERTELYIAGIELANGFSELTDPAEQRTRFEAEVIRRKAMGKEETPIPELFLRDLEQMPRSAGMALGLDRLIMMMLGYARVEHVVAFH
ncbi:MAG: EF-P lysine aminoacylase GenX [Deltaproteobacteria bacterium]|nr:MAG: EF-P lysine aminoacylase GenX [Deltaproteobacteria bacterium]